jgi:hypothetical protein
MLTRGLSETAESTQGEAEVADDAGACRGRRMRLPGSDADEAVLRVANLCTASVPGLSDGDYRGLGDGRSPRDGVEGRKGGCSYLAWRLRRACAAAGWLSGRDECGFSTDGAPTTAKGTLQRRVVDVAAVAGRTARN